jgi:hypothetical protein
VTRADLLGTAADDGLISTDHAITLLLAENPALTHDEARRLLADHAEMPPTDHLLWRLP